MKWTGWRKWGSLKRRLPNRIDFEISQRDIEVGLPLSIRRCPGALGLQRRLADMGIKDAVVEMSMMGARIFRINDPADTVCYTSGDDLAFWIITLDSKGRASVKPATFTLTREN